MSTYDWEALSREWRRTRPHTLWRRYRDQLGIALVRRWAPNTPAPRVLKTDLFDEASGRGLTATLARGGASVVGIDATEGVVTMAQENPEVSRTLTACRADVRALPFASGSFEFVLSPSTLDHFATVEELTTALAELARVLRPGGVLVVTLDNPANPLVRLRNALPFGLVHRLGLVPYFVGATLRVGRLAAELERTGLRVTDRRAQLHCPRVLALHLGRLLRRAPEFFRAGYVRALLAFEALDHLPTRWLTGHYVAVRAVKPAKAVSSLPPRPTPPTA